MVKPKPGRRTAGDLRVIPLSPGAHWLQPPADLDPEVREVFRGIVNACPESHFVASDQQLLATYCTALIVSRRAAPDVHKSTAALVIWEKSARLIGQLSSKLRLCPSSRSDAKTVARRSLDHRPSYYDLTRSND